MIELEAATDRLVRHVLVNLVRRVPWGPSREALLTESVRLQAEAAAATSKVNDIVLKELFAFNSRGDDDDALLQDIRGREQRFRMIADESGWMGELYALAAAGRYPQADDRTVERFAEDVVEDLRTFQKYGFSFKSRAARDISEAIRDHLGDEGLELADIVLPPTLEELIDCGEDRPSHIDQDRWDAAVREYNRQMTLDNTPRDFIGGGSDRDDDSAYTSNHDGEAAETPVFAMR